MSWVLAAAGFAALIVLHELGHFVAAKAVGMRVERFALFFPPLIAKVRRGETEYGIGAIPLGGYVKITGMNPNEEIPPEVAPRAYYRQPVWKRIVVIMAGPVVNIVVAFLILWALFIANGTAETTDRVGKVEPGSPAVEVLRPGDRVISVDGRGGGPEALSKQTAAHRCPGRQVDGCPTTTPARVVLEREGSRRTVTITPRFDERVGRARIGFAFGVLREDPGAAASAGLAVSQMWKITTGTIKAVVRIFDPEQRKQISGVVGSYEYTRQAVAIDTTKALTILAIISLSLAIVNLFPFLPLDGGHVFWAVAEKVRRRPIAFSTMERSGVLGFVLVIFLFLVGLTNDIDRLQGEGFKLPR